MILCLLMGKKRKSRQEKIIADLRRQLLTRQPATKPPEISPAFRETKTKEERPLSPPAYREATSSAYREATSSAYREATSFAYREATSFAYLKKDLTKTFLLSILAISFELALYFKLR